jgi:hypothetical protein
MYLTPASFVEWEPVAAGMAAFPALHLLVDRAAANSTGNGIAHAAQARRIDDQG